MADDKKVKVRHSAETEMLGRALAGDADAADKLLQSLSSVNLHLVQIMQETIHDLQDGRIWAQLLKCLATQRWDDHLDCMRRSDPEASARIDRSVFEVFRDDEGDWERKVKEAVLQRGLDDRKSRYGSYLPTCRCYAATLGRSQY